MDDATSLPVPYIGNHTVYDFDNQEYHVSVSADALVYRFCNQDFMRYSPLPVFPPLPSRQPNGSEWMTHEQESIAGVFAWTSVAAILFVLLVFVHRLVIPFVCGLVHSSYKVRYLTPMSKPHIFVIWMASPFQTSLPELRVHLVSVT